MGARGNGGIIGSRNAPAKGQSLPGVWTTAEVHTAAVGDLWGIQPKGGSSAYPASGPREIVSSGGGTTSGVYWINNWLTKYQTVQRYCHLNFNGDHWMLFTPFADGECRAGCTGTLTDLQSYNSWSATTLSGGHKGSGTSGCGGTSTASKSLGYDGSTTQNAQFFDGMKLMVMQRTYGSYNGNTSAFVISRIAHGGNTTASGTDGTYGQCGYYAYQNDDAQITRSGNTSTDRSVGIATFTDNGSSGMDVDNQWWLDSPDSSTMAVNLQAPTSSSSIPGGVPYSDYFHFQMWAWADWSPEYRAYWSTHMAC